MELKAYKSEHTGELFETEQSYKNHLKEFEREKQKIEKEKQLEEKIKKYKHEPRLTATSIGDFIEKAFKNINKLNTEEENELLILKITSKWFGEISNSHNCPINGVTNWHGKSNLPKNYLGWSCNISFEFKKKPDYTFENLAKKFPAINTGGGGGDNNGKSNYHVNLYLDDFPLLKEKYERKAKLEKYKNEWNDKINELKFDMEKNDSEVVSYRSECEELSNELARINKQRNEITEKLSNKKKSIEKEVLNNNPFKYLDEHTELIKMFK